MMEEPDAATLCFGTSAGEATLCLGESAEAAALCMGESPTALTSCFDEPSEPEPGGDCGENVTAGSHSVVETFGEVNEWQTTPHTAHSIVRVSDTVAIMAYQSRYASNGYSAGVELRRVEYDAATDAFTVTHQQQVYLGESNRQVQIAIEMLTSDRLVVLFKDTNNETRLTLHDASDLSEVHSLVDTVGSESIIMGFHKPGVQVASGLVVFGHWAETTYPNSVHRLRFVTHDTGLDQMVITRYDLTTAGSSGNKAWNESSGTVRLARIDDTHVLASICYLDSSVAHGSYPYKHEFVTMALATEADGTVTPTILDNQVMDAAYPFDSETYQMHVYPLARLSASRFAFLLYDEFVTATGYYGDQGLYLRTLELDGSYAITFGDPAPVTSAYDYDLSDTNLVMTPLPECEGRLAVSHEFNVAWGAIPEGGNLLVYELDAAGAFDANGVGSLLAGGWLDSAYEGFAATYQATSVDGNGRTFICWYHEGSFEARIAALEGLTP